MSKRKPKHKSTAASADAKPADAKPVVPSKQPLPAWRNRIGLIVAFFALTIGGSYIYLALMYTSTAAEYDYRVVAKYPHDSQAFTQGLVYREGVIYESTGQLGNSSIRKYSLETGVAEIQPLDEKVFGEGLTIWQDQLIQLTYRNGFALAHDLDLNPQGQRYEYDGEGWGLTHDGKQFIMSNGSSILQFRDPQTFEITRELQVYDGSHRLSMLNELEYAGGKLYANVWHRDFIVEIDPASGRVLSRIFLNDLFPYGQRPNDESVLNGIAFNTDTQRLLVTGKNWPQLFEIELVPRKKRP